MTLTGDPTLVKTDFTNAPSNPLGLLQHWLDEADRVEIVEPRGVVLATIDELGRPSSRVVFLKECDDIGVTFTSSGQSQKGQDLQSNPRAAGTLWWRETIQQISFKGQVKMLSAKKANEMLKERPRPARAVAAVSNQSAPMVSEAELRAKVKQLINTEAEIEYPSSWHAYQLVIESIEFWQGSLDRFHKRLRYDLVDGVWGHQQLQP